MRPAHLKVAQTVNKVPRYFGLFRDAAVSGQTLEAATHWVWLWLPEATDAGALFSKAAIRSVLSSLRTGQFYQIFPVNPFPRLAGAQRA